MAFFAQRSLDSAGLITLAAWRSALAYALNRTIDRTESAVWTERLVADGAAITVAVDGHRGHYLAPAAAAPQLRELLDGAVPAGWPTKPPATGAAVSLLSPLDPIVKGDRAERFFGFEHLWEIYKPPAKRRWGPFTMPILYGDALVGRADPRLDREAGTLHLNGIWLESPGLAEDPSFATALAEAIRELVRFLGAGQVELYTTEPAALGRHLAL